MSSKSLKKVLMHAKEALLKKRLVHCAKKVCNGVWLAL